MTIIVNNNSTDIMLGDVNPLSSNAVAIKTKISQSLSYIKNQNWCLLWRHIDACCDVILMSYSLFGMRYTHKPDACHTRGQISHVRKMFSWLTNGRCFYLCASTGSFSNFVAKMTLADLEWPSTLVLSGLNFLLNEIIPVFTIEAMMSFFDLHTVLFNSK